MTQKSYSYIGKGKVYLRSTSGGGAMPVGNCSELTLGVETNAITQPDYTTPGGGNANEVQRVSDVTLAMTMLELRPENLEIALRGTVAVVSGATVTDERGVAYNGGLVALDFIPDQAVAPVVTQDPDGTPVVATVDVDYEVSSAGIVIIDGGIFSDGDVVGVDYTKDGSSVVEAMTTSGDEYELIFDGLNEAETGKAVVVRVHRVKWSPTSGLGFIGDDFGELPLEGSVLVDSTKVGASISRYFKVSFAD
jgi:hypothetical protein